MNSRAIANAGIDEKTPDPAGGTIGRDANRKPNGFFADYDIDDWGPKAPVTEEARLEVVRRTNADANRAGITGRLRSGRWRGQDRAVGEAAGRRPADARGPTSACRPPSSTTTPIPRSLQEKVDALGEYKRYAKGLLDVTSVKIYCDGVMEYPALTAAMLAPYRVNFGTAEKPAWRPGTSKGPDPSCAPARPGFLALDKAGWQIHVHAIGDRATRDALDNFEAARARTACATSATRSPTSRRSTRGHPAFREARGDPEPVPAMGAARRLHGDRHPGVPRGAASTSASFPRRSCGGRALSSPAAATIRSTPSCPFVQIETTRRPHGRGRARRLSRGPGSSGGSRRPSRRGQDAHHQPRRPDAPRAGDRAPSRWASSRTSSS